MKTMTDWLREMAPSPQADGDPRDLSDVDLVAAGLRIGNAIASAVYGSRGELREKADDGR